MISYKHMRSEMKRLPKLIRRAKSDTNFEEYIALQSEYWTLEWILTEDDDK